MLSFVIQKVGALVVRNGYLPARKLQTGLGEVDIKVPRIPDNSGQLIAFHSSILPPYLKRTKSVEELLPWLYLKGISTNDFSIALKALLGKDASGLSSNSICRLKAKWTSEYKQWVNRDLSDLRIAYIWVDGIYLRVKLSEKQCVLVVIGPDETGKKHLLAIEEGFRESAQSWREVLLDLKFRGLKVDPSLAVGDGALGFWCAVSEVYPNTKQQRCWARKSRNILNKLPKSLQDKAKGDIHAIWMADTKENANSALDLFIEKYNAKYPKVAECLDKDRDRLLTLYDFRAQHWHHIRTTNMVESPFATVKLRTYKTKGCLGRETGLSMLYNLLLGPIRTIKQ